MHKATFHIREITIFLLSYSKLAYYSYFCHIGTIIRNNLESKTINYTDYGNTHFTVMLTRCRRYT